MSKVNHEVLIRPAMKNECRRIAGFYRISSDGVSDYIWSRLAAPGEDILEVGRRRYEREDSNFSYRNCKMVETGGEVVGMLVAFPMLVEPGPEETDPVLRPYSDLEEDQSYYICGMAVLDSHRGRGIGGMLLTQAERDCRDAGLGKLSLIVFEQNTGALRLYRRNGFEERKRSTVVPHPYIRYTGDALLMVKEPG